MGGEKYGDDDLQHTTSSVNHGRVVAWACMAAGGTGSLVFIDDDCWRKELDPQWGVQVHGLCSDSAKFWQTGRTAAFQHILLEQPKMFLGQRNGTFYSEAKSTAWSQLNRPGFFGGLLKTKLKAESLTNQQHLKAAAVKAWQSISGDVVTSLGPRLQAVCKGCSSKY